LVRIAYSVCLWFAMAFGSNQYEMRPYVEPSETEHEAKSDAPKKTSEAEDEKLAEEAKAKAKAAPKVSKAERVKRVLEAENQRPKTEKETRLLVDAAMRDAGWEADTETIRHSKGARPKKGHNMAIAEWPTDSSIGDSGYVDYAFFVDETMVGTVEAKAERKDVLSVLDVQCKDYSSHIRQVDYCYVAIEYDGRYQVPFTFATNGRPYLKQYETKSGIWSLDLRDPSNAPKPLRGWPRPQALMRMLQEDVKAANQRLADEPYDLLRDKDGLNLREYQIKAVAAAEKAVIAGRPSALIAMATGTGKTRTALAMIYRFLSTDRFRRILFLVDRDALGEQAEDAFKDVKIEQLMALDKIYEVKGLDSAEINPETRVSIATVQSMVKRIMYDDGEGNKPAVTDFDLVIVDEAHRGYILDKEMTEEESLYRDQRDYQSKYRAVIDYFDAMKIALTATPALHTTQIFGAPVFQYTYREAVIDGYLVDHDVPHTLKTKLTEGGMSVIMVTHDPD
ncbi:MAG: DEAD/DEAH box helicase family protein, partial [Coriobacteriaceae bacterium]|nr:DEAD/DEAH box helicase family protein [Coriobacteriaceae bacterium]